MPNTPTAFLLHFADSVLPVGAYAHSFGLEGLIQQGLITDQVSLRGFLLRDVWHGLSNVDLPIVAEAHRLIQNHEHSQLAELDQLARALRPTRQIREANTKIGKQTFQLYQETWQPRDTPLSKECFRSFQSPVIIGSIFAEQEVNLTDTLTTVCYQTYSALLQASLKLLPCGPRFIHQALAETMQSATSKLKKNPSEDRALWGSYQPQWDISAARHEQSHERLFIS